MVDCKYVYFSLIYQGRSSNFSEANNLVGRIRTGVEKGGLPETELLISRDNQLFESVFYNGTTRSPLLLQTVLTMQDIHMNEKLVVNVVNKSGTSMIEAVIDITSRGNNLGIIMRAFNPLKLIPLHLGFLERYEYLESWINYWWRCNMVIWPCTQTQALDTYIQTVRLIYNRYVDPSDLTRQSSTTYYVPRNIHFTDLLHGILPGHRTMQYTMYLSTAKGSSLAVNDRTMDVRVTSDRPSPLQVQSKLNSQLVYLAAMPLRTY